ncbi:MAG: hypothetical protein JSS87_01040 [Acidobacteria bacterium]|nr:hypothetical protein [Acidobacteriota bacterium]
MNSRSKRLMWTFAVLSIAQCSFAADRSENFPLRVSIKNQHASKSTSGSSCPLADGERRSTGAGNLFQNGEARGFRFAYVCPEKLPVSSGYQTYAARWKKPELILTLLIPMEGKENKFWTCDLNVQLKSFAYGRDMSSVSPQKMKAWMQKHDYDPEHGKDVPENLNTARKHAGDSHE